MAICVVCGRNMRKGVGCVGKPFQYSGKEFLPIKYGDEVRFGPDFKSMMPESKCCRDCNAVKGMYHHPGCDMEECPKCHKQAISCNCADP